MKAITFLATTFLLFLTFTISAQRQGLKEKMTPEQRATQVVERMTKQLQLDNKQQKELKTYYTDAFKKKAEARQKNTENKEAMRENMKKDQEATDAQLKKTLTSDQYKKYKTNEDKRREEMKRRGGRSGGFRK